MGVRITDGTTVALYDSVTGEAFGPVIEGEEAAEEFLRHLRDVDGRDPRRIPPAELQRLHKRWAARQ